MEATNHEAQFLHVSDTEALAALPPHLRDVTSELVGAYDVGPKPVVATALAVCAAAVGSMATVVVPQTGNQVPPAFNLVIATHDGRCLGWLNFLRARLFAQILNMQAILTTHGQAAAEKRIETNQQALETARKTQAPNSNLLQEMQDEITRQRAGLKPALFTNRFTPAHVQKVIDCCFDGAVLLADPAADPVESFLALKPGERRDLLRLLNSSWEGMPLGFDKRVLSASLSMFWSTSEAMLLPLFDSELIVGSLPTPVLYIGSPANRLRASSHIIASEKQWKKTIDRLFNFRCLGHLNEYRWSNESLAVLGKFEHEIEDGLEGAPSLLRRHLVWLPELAQRLALLFSIYKEGLECIIAVETTKAAIIVVRWLAAEHFRVLQAFAALPAAPGPDKAATPDLNDPAEVMLRKIRQKAPVTRRKLWQSYTDPKAHVFQAVLDSLLHAGKVVENGDGCFVCAEPGGSAAVMTVPESDGFSNLGTPS